MKAITRSWTLCAALLLLPLVAGTAAYAEDDGSHEHSDGGHHDGGDGHNDDGSNITAPSAGTSLSGQSQSGAVFGSGEHHRFGDIVASPTLDLQQTRNLIAQGKAASMPLLLAYLNQNYPGQVLDVKLHNASDGFVYEVRYLSNAIFLRTLFLDAATLKAK